MEKTNGSRLIKNSVLNLFNTFFNFVTGLIISIWVARQLGPNSYGVFTFLLWLTSAFSWIIGMGFIHAITKFIAEYSGKEKNAMLGPIVFFIMKIEITITLFVTAVLIFFRTEVADYFFSPTETFYFFLAFLGLLPGIVTAIFSATIEGIQKFEYFTYASLFITPLSFFSKVIVLWMGKGINGILIVMLIFSVVNSLFYYFVLKKEKIHFIHDGKVNKVLKGRIKNYNFSVLAIILCDKIIWDKSENFFLGRLCSAAEVGFYNLGFNIVQKFASILPTTFWRVLFPAMSNYSGAGNEDKMRRLYFVATRYLAFTAFPIGIGGAILSYQMLLYFYGHEYVGAQRVLQIMFLCSILTSLGPPGAAILYGYGKLSFIYKLGAIMAVVNIILDIILIRKYGAIGAAVCYAITTVVGSTIGTIYTCTVMKLKYPIVSIFKIFFSTVIMGIAMEIIILQNGEVFGFVLSIFTGGIIYLVCSLVLGTFEEEDYTLLESTKAALPHKAKKLVDLTVRFISQFKSNGKSKEEL